jgi:hypothetical protein
LRISLDVSEYDFIVVRGVLTRGKRLPQTPASTFQALGLRFILNMTITPLNFSPSVSNVAKNALRLLSHIKLPLQGARGLYQKLRHANIRIEAFEKLVKRMAPSSFILSISFAAGFIWITFSFISNAITPSVM